MKTGEGRARSPAGPVLEASDVGRAVAAAILASNVGAVLEDHGAYLRVSAPGQCVVSQSAIEAELGRRFTLPGDLELVMPAFHGRLEVGDDRVEWRFEEA